MYFFNLFELFVLFVFSVSFYRLVALSTYDNFNSYNTYFFNLPFNLIVFFSVSTYNNLITNQQFFLYLSISFASSIKGYR